MRKIFAAALMLPLLLGGATACSTSTTEAPVEPAVESAPAPAAESSVDAYCQGVEDYVAAAKAAIADPANADTAELQKQATALAEKAKGLTGELANDPSAATTVSECTQKLQTAMTGG